MDRGTWQATVHRVAESGRLKQLSMHTHKVVIYSVFWLPLMQREDKTGRCMPTGYT